MKSIKKTKNNSIERKKERKKEIKIKGNYLTLLLNQTNGSTLKSFDLTSYLALIYTKIDSI
jgi:hypothetical protein